MSISIAEWLHGLGLEQYTPVFRDNHIDADVLAELTAGDLTDLGIASIGHRRKLLSAIAVLRAAANPAADATARAPVEASFVERRQVTILFCDLVGSTELATRLDPEDLRDIIGAYHGRVSEVVARFGGFTARLMGDGVLAYFGYPTAHEDDAERAVRAGLTIVEAIAKLGLAHALQVRIGIATGLVVVGDLIGEGGGQEQTVVGDTPNLAARLQTVAGPNTVIVADGTRRQLGALFQLQDLGALPLKGFAGDQRAWRVAGESGVVSRFAALRTPETPLIGRDEELDLLLRRWAQAKSGEGRVVLLSADAGIGKSRLAEALLERIAPENHVRLRYFCSPHHQDSALFPLISQLERAAEFARDDTPSAQLEKLAVLLGADGGAQPEQFAVFADLWSLGPLADAPSAELTPQRKKDLIFDLLAQRLEALAREKPVVVVFEDLHWIDPTTRELLDRVIAHVETLPVLLIATARPEFQHSWVGHPYVTTLVLSRLGRREGAALVRQLIAAASSLPAETIDEIVERADGVPLFLEEVIKVVLESAVSTSAGPGASHRSPLAVPATLQASLMARLDRLGPVAREIAQVGATIGRDFSYELLISASPREETETRGALEKLVAAGLVFQRGRPPASDYQFKHALVQDTAYGSLLRGPRQNLHARIAEGLQRQSADLVERSPELLAHHLAEAADFDRAAGYWLEAGQRASGHSANFEAVAHLTHGITGLGRLPETPERMRLELALQLALGPVLLSTRGYGTEDSRRPYHRASELAGRLGDDRARFAASWGLWITTPGRGRDEEERLRHLGDLVEAADRIGDAELSLQAHHSAWATRIWGGEFVLSQDHVRHGLALYEPDKHSRHALMYGGHDPGVCGNGQGAIALWALGYPDAAIASAREGVALAERLKHVPSLLHALWFAGAVFILRRDSVAARGYGERLLALGQEHGLQLYRAIGGIFHGWAMAQDGHTEAGRVEPGRVAAGRQELRDGVEHYGAMAWTMLALFRALLAETDLLAGDFDAAAAQLTDIVEGGNRWWWAEFLRLRGDLERGKPAADLAAAETAYREAIAVAQHQAARSLELRAATSLARLLRDGGRRDEGAALLAPICGWFSEGRDTPDIVQAKALLESLG